VSDKPYWIKKFQWKRENHEKRKKFDLKAENNVYFRMWVKLFIGIMALDKTTQRLFGGNINERYIK
jgi:hypothetical protein